MPDYKYFCTYRKSLATYLRAYGMRVLSKLPGEVVCTVSEVGGYWQV